MNNNHPFRWIEDIGKLRDGLLLIVTITYVTGYVAWSYIAWSNGFGALPVLDAQYFLAGFPLILAGFLVFVIISEKENILPSKNTIYLTTKDFLPCLVIILGLSNLKNLFVNCALAASYFMMAATSRSLGTCWVNLGTEINDPEMINELGIPDNCHIVAPIILGYPVEIPLVPKRKEPEIIKIIT